MTLDEKALDLLFLNARTQNGWLPTPVTMRPRVSSRFERLRFSSSPFS